MTQFPRIDGRMIHPVDFLLQHFIKTFPLSVIAFDNCSHVVAIDVQYQIMRHLLLRQ